MSSSEGQRAAPSDEIDVFRDMPTQGSWQQEYIPDSMLEHFWWQIVTNKSKSFSSVLYCIAQFDWDEPKAAFHHREATPSIAGIPAGNLRSKIAT